MAEYYGHDNLVENPPRLDFSVIDYSVLNKSQLLKLDSVGVWKPKVSESICLPQCPDTTGQCCYKWTDLVCRPPCLFTMMPWVM